MNLPQAFAAVMEYGIAQNVRNIAALPGCWESQIDEHWWIAINGHDTPRACSQSAGRATVPPFSVYVSFNGWPAGIIDARGGIIAAGALANEQAFIAALQKATNTENGKEAH